MARASWIGETLGGRYKIEKLLGKGGMSAVYQATDPNLRRVVAVKLIHTHLSDDPAFVRRFMEEAATVAQLRHPNIIQVFDFNHDEDTYFIVFEFIPGETLHERLKRLNESSRRMDVKEAVSIAGTIAGALQYAHGRNLVHRDVKPANVMLNIHNQPILMDFGIVKIVGGTTHTATGATVGTARYMAPEQIRGENIDPRTDIYSLGVMLYEMLAGRAPFQADSAMTMMMMHITDPVPPLDQFRPDLPPQLRQVVEKALAKNPDERYQTAGAFANALAQVDWDATPVGAAATAPAAAPTVVEPLPSEVQESLSRTPPPQPAARPPAAVPPVPPASRPESAASGMGRTPLIVAGISAGLILLLLLCVAGAYAIGLFGGEDGTPVAEVALTETAAAEGTATAGAEGTPGTEATPTVGDDDGGAGGVPDDPTATDTAEPAATATDPPPTATRTPAPPTDTPTPTVTPLPEFFAQITDITLSGDRYIVEYVTYGYEEVLPGMHVHFFFNTVPPEQAGAPHGGPWYVWGGPRPFDGYTVNDRPAGADAMCALVANPDHSVIAESGNCLPLP